MKEDLQWISLAAFQKPLVLVPSAWVTHGPFAFWLIENLKPNSLVELGTYFGYSYLCFCQQVLANGLATRCAAIDTWRGDEHSGFYDDLIFTKLQACHNPAYENFSTFIRSTFDDAVFQFEDSSIDLLHIDGRHYYEDVKHDFENWKSKLSNKSVVLFHDTQVREKHFGVWKFWQELSKQFPHIEFYHGHGLGVLCFGGAPEARGLPIFSPTLNEDEKTRIRTAYETLGKRIENSVPLRRNELCPCGSGERFKHCHGELK